MAKSYQRQYAEILRRLINEPDKKTPSRVGDVRSRFVETIRVDLRKEFPLMEIKQVSFKNILVELLWFIKGNTNIKFLVDNGCNIWNDDSYRYYSEKYSQYRFRNKPNYLSKQLPLGLDVELTKEEFLEKVKNGERLIDQYLKKDENGVDYLSERYAFLSTNYTYGDLDKIYGYQWRNFNGSTDQLAKCITTLKENPDDRRIIVSAHNPTDLELGNVGLPSCHNYFQFYTRPLSIEERIKWFEDNLGTKMADDNVEEFLNINNVPKRSVSLYYNIRSNDFFLGQPYNTPSYALLLIMVAKVVNMQPEQVVCNAVDCHLYEVHLDAANEWLDRYSSRFNGENTEDRETFFTFCNSSIKIKRDVDDIDKFKISDFELKNYRPDSRIKAPLLT